MNEMIANHSESAVHEDARKCTIRENGLNEQQQTAIEMLILGKAVGAVAKALQIAPSTLYRWRQDELFREALDARRAEVWGGATDRLKDLVHPSIEVMAEHLADRYDRARFRAASMVLRLVNLKQQGAEID